MLNSLAHFWNAFWAIPHVQHYLGLAWLGYLVGLGLWILLQKREPAATMSWLLGLAFLPYLGLLVYYLFGPQRIVRQRRRRARLVSGRERLSRGDVGGRERGIGGISDMVDAATGFPASAARDCRLLVDGSATYRAICEAVAVARRHVHAEYYIFAAGRSSETILEALTAAAARGVTVRLLLDSVGSGLSLQLPDFRALRAAGGEVAWFHRLQWWRLWKKPWINLRSHRKILVVDGEIGFVGGINITDEENEALNPDAYRDLHLRLQGDIVRSLDQLFLEDWSYTHGEPCSGFIADAQDPAEDLNGSIVAQILSSGPDDDWEAIHRAWVSLMHAAQERVWLSTPYFVPGEAALMALTSAALRGLDVRLVLPRRSDNLLATLAARSYYDALFRAGVRVFEYGPRMLHSKALCIDRDIAVVGSANFDHRSFRLNFEVACGVRDEGFVRRLCEVMEEDILGSEEQTPPDRRNRLLRDRIPQGLARLLSPLL